MNIKQVMRVWSSVCRSVCVRSFGGGGAAAGLIFPSVSPCAVWRPCGGFWRTITNEESSSARGMSAMRSFGMLIIAAAAVLSVPVSAQTDYPSKPLRIIVPYPPGGGNDLLARVVGDKLSKRWGQAIVVENRPGGSGNIGAELALRAPADGYTLLIATNSMAIAPHIMRGVPFDIRTDFAPVARLISTPFVLVVNPAKLPVNSVGELVAYAKANPGRISYASSGNGTLHHLGMELFKNLTKVDMVHVPYRGSAAALADLLAGEIQLWLVTTNVVVSAIERNTLRALGVAETRRSQSLPVIPTIIEAGVPGFEVTSWYGILTRAGTPAPIVRKLSQALQEIVTEPDVRDRLMAAGFEISPAGPEEVQRSLLDAYEKWGKIVRDAGIRPE